MGQSSAYAALMLAAGIGIPIMAALNARLGAASTPMFAVLILVSVATLSTLAIVTARGAWPAAWPAAPAYTLLAGLLFVFYIASITWVIPRFGVAKAVFFVLLGQLVTAAAIDHFGAFGVASEPLDARRALGLVLMATGIFLALR